jgi:hypothetical protein
LDAVSRQFIASSPHGVLTTSLQDLVFHLGLTGAAASGETESLTTTKASGVSRGRQPGAASIRQRLGHEYHICNSADRISFGTIAPKAWVS